MLKWGGSALCLLILTVFFAFSYVGCVQEEVDPASVEEDVVLSKKGDVDLYKNVGDPDDCHCYMKVLSVQNAESAWSLYDYTDDNFSTGYLLHGFGNDWWFVDTELFPFPSDFQELDVPSYGEHRLALLDNNSPDNFQVSVEIHCQYEVNGTSLGGRTYYFDFQYGDGLPYGDARLFDVDLACRYEDENPR